MIEAVVEPKAQWSRRWEAFRRWIGPDRNKDPGGREERGKERGGGKVGEVEEEGGRGKEVGRVRRAVGEERIGEGGGEKEGGRRMRRRV